MGVGLDVDVNVDVDIDIDVNVYVDLDVDVDADVDLVIDVDVDVDVNVRGVGRDVGRAMYENGSPEDEVLEGSSCQISLDMKRSWPLRGFFSRIK